MIPVPLPCSSHAPEFCFVRVIVMQRRTVLRVCGIERKIGGQCDCCIGIFESIQIKTILNYEFETVLSLYLKRSKSSQETPVNQAFAATVRQLQSTRAERFHQHNYHRLHRGCASHGAHGRCDGKRPAARLQQRRGVTQIRTIHLTSPRRAAWPQRSRFARLLDRDIGGAVTGALDVLFDVDQRAERGLQCVCGDVVQNIGCDVIAQAVEIVDQLAAARRQK
jgi:hypothetical protein